MPILDFLQESDDEELQQWFLSWFPQARAEEPGDSQEHLPPQEEKLPQWPPDDEFERLSEAVKRGDEAEVEQLLQKFSSFPGVSLENIPRTNNERITLRLLEFDTRLQSWQGGGPAFLLAVKHGRSAMVARLMEAAAAGEDGIDADLIEKTSSLGETALQLAARLGQLDVIAAILQHKPKRERVLEAFWGVLNKESNNSEAHEQALKLLLEHDPSPLQEVDFRGNTILHYVLGGGNRFSPEFITWVWRLHPPALHTGNMCGVTPFQRAEWSNNEFALNFFQGEVPLDQGMSCVTSREFLDSHCAQPLWALPKVLVEIVYEYLGFQPHKRGDKKDYWKERQDDDDEEEEEEGRKGEKRKKYSMPCWAINSEGDFYRTKRA